MTRMTLSKTRYIKTITSKTIKIQRRLKEMHLSKFPLFLTERRVPRKKRISSFLREFSRNGILAQRMMSSIPPL